MSDITVNDPSTKKSQPLKESRKKISKQMVIKIGMNNLQDIGSDPICKVCIANGGSCCNGCLHLTNGAGCQLRNTSCTAWLCGFLKYVLYETGLLQEWNDFWDQVPGKEYRADYTPEYFFIHKSLHIENLRDLSEALASDLMELVQTHIKIGYIFTLREKMDKSIDQFIYYKNDPVRQAKIKKTIKFLSRHFHRFHIALSNYKENRPIIR
jgi:hypothetical protein